MIDNVIIIDDCISVNYQDGIQKEILYNKNFPWYYAPSLTSWVDGDINPNSGDSWGLGHQFYRKPDGGPTSSLSSFLLPLMYQACDKINFVPNELYWGRCFLSFPQEHKTHNLLHVDTEKPHLVCLYYVNDSDGDTVITTLTSGQADPKTANMIGPEIKWRIRPKKGRCVLFDGKFYHASTNPSLGKRCIINFDIV